MARGYPNGKLAELLPWNIQMPSAAGT
jgi:hypothetical protein